MATIKEIRENTYSLLKEAYLSKDGKGKYVIAPLPHPASSDEIEQAGFMRKQDAEAIRKACMNKIIVSFRSAGADTIQRIQNGHPCKGHEITDKSIKNSKGEWTYLLPADSEQGMDGYAIFEKLKGLVGCPNTSNSGGSIDNTHSTSTLKVILNADGSVNRRIFPLKEVYVLPSRAKAKGQETSACSYAKLPYQEISPAELQMAYTGDYDMHDLIYLGRRAISTTPEEHTAIDMLNNAILNSDKKRQENVKNNPGKFNRIFNSPYALIRHGAQTSYLDFLTTSQGHQEMLEAMEKVKADLRKYESPFLPFEKSIIKIDDNIVVFDTKGQAFILKGVKQIYNFYAAYNLLDQIPFYNFFNALRAVDFGSETAEIRAGINANVVYMLTILGVDLSLMGNHPWQRH